MSDIAEIEAHLNRAQSAYDKLPLSGPVTSWCELYGEDLLDSCTKLLAALKQRTGLIDAAAGHWLESCRVTSPPIPWEGAIDGAMEAACKEVKRLRARVAELEAAQEWRPIDSAPKDGAAFHAVDARTESHRVVWFDDGAKPPFVWHVDDAAEGFNHHADFFTHWLPLPAPPKVAT